MNNIHYSNMFCLMQVHTLVMFVFMFLPNSLSCLIFHTQINM